MSNTRMAQPLFKAMDADGSEWFFAVRSDGGWEITHDGQRIAIGTGTAASIDIGVRRFLSCTAAEEPQLEPTRARQLVG